MTLLSKHSGPECNSSSGVHVPYAEEMLSIAHQSYSFQTREVLQRIVLGEQQRIKEEQMLWRLGGAVLGACFGLSDGFQMTDLFMGMAGASVASLAHDVMSHEDRKFLEQCQSLWLVGRHSPMELAQRLGPARSRVILFDPSWESPVIFNHHQGYRGDHLVPLGNAGNQAAGFQDGSSMEVMSRYFDSNDLEVLQSQLYPIAEHATAINKIQPISKADALAIDPHASAFTGKSKPMQIETNDCYCVGYQVPIPATSDF